MSNMVTRGGVRGGTRGVAREHGVKGVRGVKVRGAGVKEVRPRGGLNTSTTKIFPS